MDITFSAPGVTVSTPITRLPSARSVVRSGLTISQNEFIQKYGKYSHNYSLVNQLGKQEQSMVWGFFFLFLIFFIIFILIWSKTTNNKKENGSEKKKTNWISKILRFLILFSLGGFGISGLYLFIYWVIFKIQYFDWFGSLPTKAQIVYGAISATRGLISK